MLPIGSLVLTELFATLSGKATEHRIPEPASLMTDRDQVDAYVQAYAWNGPTSALLLYNLYELSSMIRPGETVVDLACGPGHLLIELAELFPTTNFIGVDLAPEMLDRLVQESEKRNLKNIEVRCEDISKLNSFSQQSVDLVISVQALHHLPDIQTFSTTLKRIAEVLKPDGAFHLFDFGLLKSNHSRKLIVKDVAREVSPITAKDYYDSLSAAFPCRSVLQCAEQALPKPFQFHKSLFIDFYFLLQRGRKRQAVDPKVSIQLRRKESNLRFDRKLELASLRHLAKSKSFY